MFYIFRWYSYIFKVCAGTSKGKGPKASLNGCTSELGAHAPEKPSISILGRHELHVSWNPPENPLGKINRYDITVNGKVQYSGTDLSSKLTRLHPDTEYQITVRIW